MPGTGTAFLMTAHRCRLIISSIPWRNYRKYSPAFRNECVSIRGIHAGYSGYAGDSFCRMQRRYLTGSFPDSEELTTT